jgi:glycosyltransferase involved in cell wall biosynthesis
MVNQYMAEGLAELGHEVTVVTCFRPETEKQENHNKVNIVRFKVDCFLKYNYGEKREYQKYVLEKRDTFDVILSITTSDAFTIWLYPLLNQIHCRKVMYQHGMYDGHLHLNRVHSLERLIKQLLLTPYWELFHRRHWKQIMKYDACIHLFEGDSSHRYFEQRGFLNNVVIMNSCEQSLFEPVAEEDESVLQKYDVRAPYFIYVANFCSRKDQKLAVQSFYRMKNQGAELVLIGSTENGYLRELKELEVALREKNPKHGKVHMLAGISRQDTVSFIRKSYACLMSSNNEYLPITIIEAMACGKPYISTNVGVVSKLPGGVIASEPEDLTYWMEYYLNHFQMVEQMGQIASQYVRENMYLEDKVRQLECVLIGE